MMKNLAFLMVLAVLAALALGAVVSCGGGGGDDDDDAGDDDGFDPGDDDDDADDDDDDIDDIDADLTVSDLVQGACAKDLPDPSTEPHDMVEIRWVDGALEVNHIDAIVNCGFDLDVAATLESGVIEVVETDVGDPADCYCSADITYTIEDIPSGDFKFQLTTASAAKGGDASLIAELVVTLDTFNWEWGIPTIDLVALEELGDAAPGEQVGVRVSPCYLQDKGSAQYSYRIVDGAVQMLVFDKRSIDFPEEEDPLCIFETVMVTAPSSGTYALRANSFNFPDQHWELKVSADELVVN
ncbi:MAG: hypothetical protein M5R36_18560 [Deltaproteobacteria bacterium]|nr:hypothetical protein [Deltaproteobacteria bacterium]